MYITLPSLYCDDAVMTLPIEVVHRITHLEKIHLLVVRSVWIGLLK